MKLFIAWQIGLIGIFITWAIFIIIYVNFFYKRKFKFLLNQEVQNSSTFPAYTRDDFAKWNFFEMTIVGIFIFPFRFVGSIILIFLGWLGLKILALFFCRWNYDREFSPCFKWLASIWLKILCRCVLFLDGFIWIKKVVKKYRNQNPKLISCPNSPVTITISNHVSWVDIFYFLSTSAPGFIAKAGVKKMPYVGFISQLLQCIFIDRINKDSRNIVFRQLSQRIEMITEGRFYNHMLIFPEGSTTNGKGLIDFKKGAFVALKPIKVYALKYTSRFSPALNMMTEINVFIGMCLQFFNGLTVYEFEHPIGPAKNVTWEEYAENLKALMCDELKFKNLQNTFEDKIKFELMFTNFKKEDYI